MRLGWRHVSLAATILAAPLSGSAHREQTPDVAAWNGSDPYYVMVFRSALPGQRDRHVIRSQVIARDGQPVGDPVRVLDPGRDRKAYSPKIALSPVDGTFVMVWVDRRRTRKGEPEDWSVRAIKLSPRGRPLGGSRRISGHSDRRIYDPRIVWGRSSNAYFGVAWREGRLRRIAARVVRYDLKPRERVMTIARGEGSHLSPPSLTGNKAGWFAVAWTRPKSDRQEIYMRQFRASGLRPVHRVAGIDPRQLFEHPDEHVDARATEPALSFDYKRRQDRLAWNVVADSGRRQAGAIAAVPLDERTHARLAQPVLLEHDPPATGRAYNPRIFARDRAPTADVVWRFFDWSGRACINGPIQHRRVTTPWRPVGPMRETLSSPDDPPGRRAGFSCGPTPTHPAIAGTYAEAPNTIYVWESDPYIVGVVR